MGEIINLKKYHIVKGFMKLSPQKLKEAFPKASQAARDSVKGVVMLGHEGYTGLQHGLPVSDVKRVVKQGGKYVEVQSKKLGV